MKWITKLLKFLFWSSLLGVVVGVAGAVTVYYTLAPSLPETENLKDVQFQVPLRIYSADNKLISEFGEKRRIPLTFESVPEKMIQAFLAAEDDRYFEHPGVDYQGIMRAAIQLALTGERRQGGSTITMQVARNFYLSSEKTFLRKINEILLALKIEQDLSKEEILELYLNKIYLGHRAYGVGAAAQVYYGKSVDQLDLAQIAMIAGLPKAPSRYNPVTNPERATVRRNYVLGRMAELDYISREEMTRLVSEPVSAEIHTADIEVQAPYIAEMVRSEMVNRFGDNAYTDGYSVVTTLISGQQHAANSAIRKALQAYDLRHGYRGPEQHIEIDKLSEEELGRRLMDIATYADLQPAVVLTVEEQSATLLSKHDGRITLEWKGLEWARSYIDENRRGAEPKLAQEILSPGDIVRLLHEPAETDSADKPTEPGAGHWRLAQIPEVAGALVSLNPNNGAITSLAGGYDFFLSKFNRVTQAERQPGSGFKAIIYSAALEAGYTPASLINDAPVVFNDPSLEGAWRPENYSGKFFGPTRLRFALTKSRNLVSIRLLRDMGIRHALAHAKRFGFDPEALPHNLSLALGSGAVTPLQMARAYAVLANGGYLIEPFFLTEIRDNSDEVIFSANPPTVCDSCPEAEWSNQAISTTEGDTTQQPASTEAQLQTEGAAEEADTPKAAPRVISAQNHYLMNSMMRDVINRGTATRAKILGRQDLAGKTGTTNDQRDAWFNGFNSNLVAVSWVGFDSSKPLGRGEVGGRAALPAWIHFMRHALEDMPQEPLEMPEGIVTVKIDPDTGKRAHAGQGNAIYEVFREEYAPQETVRQNEMAGSQQRGDTGTPVQDLF